jgi:hypothetical protein
MLPANLPWLNVSALAVTSIDILMTIVDILMAERYVPSMRTTIRLDENLLWEAKAYALAHKLTLTQLIEVSLRESLARRSAAKQQPRIELPTSGEGGLQPGVDLSDSKALWDLMDGVD